MKIYILLGAVLALPLSAPTPQRIPNQTIAITNVTVIDSTGAPPRSGATVIISGSRISQIVDSGSRRVMAGEIVDGSGKFLIPGLWDMHTHLAYVGDVTCTTLVAYGVTSVRDPC
jgi:N-acyl-D-aspartate/D-glutamate deacylase